MNEKLLAAAKASARNAMRLLNDAEMLEFEDPPATSLFLGVIAQEEYAKAFLLALAAKGVLPWNGLLLRATRDHTCKQLIGVVLDYISPDLDEFLARSKALRAGGYTGLPPTVVDALNVFRHEKISRWESRNWVWAEDPDWDREALRVAEGKRDAWKQDALYVRLGSDGSVASEPSATKAMAAAERDRAERFGAIVAPLLESKEPPSFEYRDIEEVLRILFAPTEEAT